MSAPVSHALFSVRDLNKRYGQAQVVQNLSFDIAPGQCLGVIGPNGAGKTTTIRMCLGLTAPDAGQVLFTAPQGQRLSMPRDALAIKARLGVVSQFDSRDRVDAMCRNMTMDFQRERRATDPTVEVCDFYEGYAAQEATMTLTGSLTGHAAGWRRSHCRC